MPRRGIPVVTSFYALPAHATPLSFHRRRARHGDHDTDGHDVTPFVARDRALISLATGVTIESLRELRDGLLAAPEASLYHHFWGRLLRPHFDEPEYLNDFASWVYHSLHEKTLAERMSLIDPTAYLDMEDLRHELVELVEQRLDESEFVPWAKADQRFYFLSAQLVVFDGGLRVNHPADLSALLPHFSTSSLYYHFIDARRRNNSRCDDFCGWLGVYGDEFSDVIHRLSGMDPYFSSLRETRRRMAEIFTERFGPPEEEGTAAGESAEGWDDAEEGGPPESHS